MKMTVLLHGFWGQPMDWNPVVERLPLATPLWIPDLYQAGPLSPKHELEAWTLNFLEQLHARAHHQAVQIVGYSMGGRLALNAVMRAPQLFDRALFLSSAPYLPEEESCEERERWERQWAERFASQGWAELESAWQDQPVFAGTRVSPRRQMDSLRASLGQSLVNWSVRLHPFRQTELKGLAASREWAFGALDQKYMGWAKQLQDLPLQGQIHTIPNAGHRLLADAPDFICQWIQRGGE